MFKQNDFSHIYSHLSYCILIWHNSLSGAKLSKLQNLQNKCIEIIKPKSTSQFTYLKILNINSIIELENMKLAYKFMHNLMPTRIHDLLLVDQNHQRLTKSHHYNTCHKSLPNKPLAKHTAYKNSFLCKWIDSYQPLPTEIKSLPNLPIFVKKVKSKLIENTTTTG